MSGRMCSVNCVTYFYEYSIMDIDNFYIYIYALGYKTKKS